MKLQWHSLFFYLNTYVCVYIQSCIMTLQCVEICAVILSCIMKLQRHSTILFQHKCLCWQPVVHHEITKSQWHRVSCRKFVQTSSRASWNCNVLTFMRLICADIRHPVVHHEIAMAQPVFFILIHMFVLASCRASRNYEIAMCWNLCCHPIMHHENAMAQPVFYSNT